jgi:hypothetical protein
MSEPICIIDLAVVRPLLDALAAAAVTAAAPVEALLSQAEGILDRLLAAPRRTPAPPDAAIEADAAGWQALHCSGEPGEESVLCWRDAPPPEFSLQGTWSGGRLENVTLLAGGRVWGVRVTPWGELQFEDPEGALDGPALERMAVDSGRRARQHRENLAAALSTLGGWDCPDCGWFNETAAVLCGGCGCPAPAAAPVPAAPAAPAAASGQSGLAFLTGSLLAAIQRAARQMAASSGTPPPAAPDACTSCGTAWEAGDRFCSGCGAARRRLCPACHHTVRPDAAFCAACGAPLPQDPSSGRQS